MDVFKNIAERFEERMRDAKLFHSDDPERCHRIMDYIMCETLEEFGCHEGVKIFQETAK